MIVIIDIICEILNLSLSLPGFNLYFLIYFKKYKNSKKISFQSQLPIIS